MSGDFYTKDVTDILDLFYDRDGHEPDWAAIKTRLYAMEESYYQVILGLLRAMWAVYEDTAAFDTLMYRLNEGSPDK
jgi:hypothetical protein